MGYIGAGITRFNTADELTVTGDAQIDTTTLVVDSTNNRVGVGNASPATALDVTGTVTADDVTVTDTSPLLDVKGDGDGFPTFRIRRVNGVTKDNRSYYYRVTSSGELVLVDETDSNKNRIRLANSGDISFYADNGTTQALFFDASTQRLGLGTTSPATALDITGTVTADDLKAVSNTPTVQLKSPNSSNGYQLLANVSDSVDGGISIQDVSESNAKRFNIDNNGDISFYATNGTTQGLFWDASTQRLGLGTTTPDKDLTVSGEVKITGGLPRLFFDNTSDGIGEVEAVGLTATDLRFGFSQDNVVFRSGSAERMRINSSGNVGIGTVSPTHNLDVFNSASSGAPLLAQFKSAGGDTQLYVDNSTITTQLTADASNTAGIVGTKTNHPFVFRTNNAERMRISSGGHLLVGKTSQDSTNTVGFEAKNTGEVTATVDGATTAFFNRKTSDGDVVVFRKDNTTVGSIASRSGLVTTLILDPRSGQGAGLTGAGSQIVPVDETGAIVNDDVNLGQSGGAFKDLYLSGSVNFSGNEISGTNITIADDAVGTVTPPRNGGFFTIVYNGIGSFPFSTHSSFVYYDVGGSLAISKATDHGSNLSVTTSNVTGTTGTDGHTTVSAQSGVLKIENRSGNSSSYQITFT